MAERSWVLCFEQWPGGGKFHVRRPMAGTSVPPALPPTFCGRYGAQGPTRFEDELDEADMCKTCRKRAIAQAEKERNYA